MAAKSKAIAEAAVAVETAPVASAVTQTALVVAAYKGTEDQMRKVWIRMTGESPVVLTADPEIGLKELLAEIVSMPEVKDSFILVPANCVPCCPISLEELAGPFVYVDAQGNRIYNERLPHSLGKEKLVEALSGEDTADLADEVFLKAYYKKNLHRPIEAGFKFGNIVTPVRRADPCENIVIGAFVTKKFVTATAEGYAAISALIDQYLLNR